MSASRGFGRKEASERPATSTRKDKKSKPLPAKEALYVRVPGSEDWSCLGSVSLPKGGDARSAVGSRIESLEREARRLFPQLALESGTRPLQFGIETSHVEEDSVDVATRRVEVVHPPPAGTKSSTLGKATFQFVDEKGAGSNQATDARGRKRWNSPKLMGLEGGARMKK